MNWKTEVQQTADAIRRRVLEHVLSRNGGYLSQACSSAEIFAMLYKRILHLKQVDVPIVPRSFTGTPSKDHPAVTGAVYNGDGDPNCDSFIVSPAQYALVVYTVLVETGRMDACGMNEYDKDGGVVEMIGAEHSPGMEATTGSLGQGISQAAGIAFARREKKEPGKVVVFLSDGECQSGQFWEAVEAIAYHKLSNMLMYVDMNGYQCDGKTSSVMQMEPFDERLRSFGIRVLRINGHDLDQLEATRTLPPCDQPTFVICDTDSTRGMKPIQDRYPKFHYVRFTNADEKARYQKYYDDGLSEGQ